MSSESKNGFNSLETYNFLKEAYKDFLLEQATGAFPLDNGPDIEHSGTPLNRARDFLPNRFLKVCSHTQLRMTEHGKS